MDLTTFLILAAFSIAAGALSVPWRQHLGGRGLGPWSWVVVAACIWPFIAVAALAVAGRRAYRVLLRR